MGGAVIGVGAGVASRELDALIEATQQRLEVQALSLSNAVARFEYLPYTVALNPDLAELAAHPDDKTQIESVNRYLEQVNREAGSTALYLMDPQGRTLATSNWQSDESYAGLNFGFRPYFLDAVAGGMGRFYGVGVSTGRPGYFMASPVRKGMKVVAVVAVKVSLDALENAWAHAVDRVAVFDARGVVILSGEPEWRLHALAPLSPDQVKEIRLVRQYGRDEITPLDWRTERTLSPAVRVLRTGLRGSDRQVLAIDRPMPTQNWTVTLLADHSGVTQAALQARAATALLCAVLALTAWVWRLRRRRGAEQAAARRALEDAHADLERMVNERTTDLVQANRALQSEVTERGRAERELRAAQQELVQAAKLAVVGQMAAGVTHELNQPLSALDALAAATRAYLDQSRIDAASDNLTRMRELVARMGRITGQLRSFSRRSEGVVEGVVLSDAVGNACFLLDQLIRYNEVSLDRSAVPAALHVAFDATRLEQVLVNLLRNAIDATRGRTDRTIALSVTVLGERVQLDVRDNGSGISPEAWPHLFDPFFTTKPPGEGLGLGLAISQSIARDCGATLEALPVPAGTGAWMRLEMSLWSDAHGGVAGPSIHP